MVNVIISFLMCLVSCLIINNYLAFNYVEHTVLLLCDCIKNNCLILIEDEKLIDPYFDKVLVEEVTINYLSDSLKSVANKYKYSLEFFSENLDDEKPSSFRLAVEINVNLISKYQTSKLVEVTSIYE